MGRHKITFSIRPSSDYVAHLRQNTKSTFWYHVHQLLEEVPRRLAEGGDDLIQVVVTDPLLEHLLQVGKDQAHRDSFGFCIPGSFNDGREKMFIYSFAL